MKSSSQSQAKHLHYKNIGRRFVTFTAPIYGLFFILTFIAKHYGLLSISWNIYILSLLHILSVQCLSIALLTYRKPLNRQDIKYLLWFMNLNNIPFFILWHYFLGDLHSIMYVIALTSTIALFTIANFFQALSMNTIIVLGFLISSLLSIFNTDQGFSFNLLGPELLHIAVFFIVAAWLSFLAEQFTLQRRKLGQSIKAYQQSQQQLQIESEAKSQFLAKMSHEIRTPMTGVLGMIELLQSGESDSKRRHYLSTAKNSGELLLNVVNGILDFSKIEADEMKLEAVPTDLKTLLEECITTIQPTAQEKNIQIKKQINSHLPQVLTDPTRLKQVVLNLLSNAIKFTHKGYVRLEAQAQVTNSNTAQLMIKVCDTGIGISEQQQGQLFKPFHQCDSTITRHFGGTGLGLVICKQIVELMQGSIDVESHKEQGSCFTIELELPVIDDQKAPSNTTQTAPSIAHELHAAVIDDNPVNTMVVSGLLSRMNVSCKIYHSGYDFIDDYKQYPTSFNFILLDCEMPQVSGYKTSELLREFERQAKVPPVLIFAFTAHAIQEYIDRCFESGMNDIIVKPLKPEDLQDKLREYFS